MITFADLLVRASVLTGLGRRCLLGIAGPPGSGKTSLAERLGETLGPERAVVFGLDGFHLADPLLRAHGLADRKGAPETFDRVGFTAMVERLRANQSTIYLPVFDRAREESIACARAVVTSVPLVIIEGNYLIAWPEVRKLITTLWYLEPPNEERIESLVARHVQYGKTPEQARDWVMRSDEANTALIGPTRGEADLVISNRV